MPSAFGLASTFGGCPAIVGISKDTITNQDKFRAEHGADVAFASGEDAQGLEVYDV